MNIELELSEKYEGKLEQAEGVDPSVRDRIEMKLEQQAMELIIEAASQAEQVEEQQNGDGSSELPP